MAAAIEDALDSATHARIHTIRGLEPTPLSVGQGHESMIPALESELANSSSITTKIASRVISKTHFHVKAESQKKI
jgi:hypothetical protein